MEKSDALFILIQQKYFYFFYFYILSDFYCRRKLTKSY